MAVSGKLKAFYLAKSAFTSLGVYTLTNSKHSNLNMLFTGLFGLSVLIESVPCVAGILVLFSQDICSVLAGISGNPNESEQFLKFCRGNIESIRMMGSAVIVGEVIVDAVIFCQMVKYQKYLKAVQRERISLNYYNGKERIALPWEENTEGIT